MDIASVFAFFKQLQTAFDLPAILLVFCTMVYVMLLLKWHATKGPFDLRTSLLDPPPSGAASLSRLGQLTALVVSTELLLYFASMGKLQEWMYAAYMTVWAGTYLASKKMSAPEPKEPK